MAAGKYTWKICQGADEPLNLQWLDANGLGVDLSTYTLRMDIRAPDRTAATAVISLTETPNANGSVIEALTEVIIAPTATTNFTAETATTDATISATGIGFQATAPTVTYNDSGVPTSASLVTSNVAKIGDILRVAGSTSNDGDYTISGITDADTVSVLESVTTEAAAGTVSLIRYGLIRVTLDSLDTEAFTFDDAEYDIEIVDGSGIVTRIIQGKVKLDKEATR